MSALYRSAIVTEEFLHDTNKYWCEQCLRYNEAKRCVRSVSYTHLDVYKRQFMNTPRIPLIGRDLAYLLIPTSHIKTPIQGMTKMNNMNKEQK